MNDMPEEDKQLNLSAREEKILEFWDREKIFEKTLAKTRRGKTFVFYEGPPTANGSPHIGHMESRAFKDVIPRYKTMRGFFVPRKAGWDTHGLQVEIGVEKELGLKAKQDIERYGIAKFNEKCRESVWRYKEEWERFTKRIGFWLDLDHPYITYETSYIETLWWIIKEIWRKGLLYQDFKVLPWCPRCQTGLSSHELGQPGAYKKVKEDSIFVRFPVKRSRNESLLIWTTTPWTVPGNVAVAVNPKIEYTKFKVGDEFIWSATTPPYDPKGTKPQVIEKMSGKALIGLEYEPPYHVNLQPTIYNLQPPHKVVDADFVTTEEGTGFVHLAPAFGEEDMAVMKSEYPNSKSETHNEMRYPILETVNPDGTMKKGVMGEGKSVKDADKVIIEDLKKRGLLFFVLPYEHEYPHCWRCDTPLLYYAKNSWWIRMTEIKNKLIKNNQSIAWIPEHIRDGRFGEFLTELRDWAFSRERYWGTPLPVWECEKCQTRDVIGSLEELAKRSPKSGNTYFAMRHGESETQLLGIAADSNSRYRLTEKGKEQVTRTAAGLKKEHIDIIFHSDVLRTTEAAKIVAQTIGVQEVRQDLRIREINVGIFNGRPTKEYHQFYSSLEEKFEKPTPSGESLNDVRKRVMDFMKELEAKYCNKKILIVSHEYPIWILDGASRGLDRENIIRLRGKKADYVGLAEVIPIPFKNLPRDPAGEVNLHRPFADDFEILCKKCSGRMRRVKDVADVWFDSGAMPFAQAHFPFVQQKENAKYRYIDISKSFLYPADFIAEAVDQTRGWFYTLLAVATLLGKGAPYRHVISLGHVLDKNGQKMSKSKGNVVNPWDMIQKYGADTIRWYFYTVNPPGEPKRFDEKDLLLKLRGPLSTLWNSFILFSTYTGKIGNRELPVRGGSAFGGKIGNSKNVLDRWIIARVEEVTAGVTMSLDRYDIVSAARALERFVGEDFSNWYLRRSRRRFQKPERPQEKKEAETTTAYVLIRLAELFAPFTPFLADALWRELKRHIPLKEASVHLRSWPEVKATRGKINLLLNMREARELVVAALALRARAGIKVRQPLASLHIPRSSFDIPDELFELVKGEVNVKEVRFGKELKLDTIITPELREEGWMRELVRNVQEMRKDLGLKPAHNIKLQIVADREFSAIANRWSAFIKKETGAKIFTIDGKKIFKAERELSLDGHEIWMGVEKA